MAKSFGEDFAEEVKINRFKLDEECEVQASLYYFYAEAYAKARAKRDAIKDKLDYVLGTRETHIRRNPPDDMKVTEAVISALLAQDTEVLDAKERYREAQAEVDTLYAATSALDHRRSQLDNLVSIWSKEYYNSKTSDGDDVRSMLNKRKGE